jgi:hypothetical protein
VRLNGEQVGSETTAMRSGPDVLTVISVLPDRGVLCQLTSVFVGYKGVPTHAAHLLRGPLDREIELVRRDHEHDSLDPIFRTREWAYEHVQVLIERLTEHGFNTSVDIDDGSFEQLERIED